MIKKLLFLASISISVMTAKSQLVITEIMYNPPESGTDSLEYIEIYNNTQSPIDLSNYSLVVGTNTNNFPSMMMNAGEYLAFSNDSVSFRAGYGFSVRNIPYSGISNGGTAIKIKDVQGLTIDSVTYDDVAPWPTQPDGFGYSLELCDVNVDNSNVTSWRSSANPISGLLIAGTQVYGTPNAVNSVSCAAIVVPQYTIDVVNNVDTLGIPDSNGVYCWISNGIVTSIDFDGNAGYSFYMQDRNANGINVYASTDEPGGYQPTIGDSIWVRGSIGHFRGLLEVITDSIVLKATVNTPLPTIVTTLTEGMESVLVTVENVHFYDTALLSSGTVYVITPLNDTLELFFDTDANITFIPDFTKNYNITGLISQNDFSSPFDEFYRLLPRFDADFVEMVTTNISQNKFDKIIVYPNPVLQGNSLSVNRNITASIYDVSGRIVTNVFNSNKISTIGLQKGVYLLVGDEINFKFIVE